MEPINTFAQAPQTSEGYYNRNNAIAPEIIKYLEDHSDLRQFFTPKPMKGVLSKTFRIEKDEGIAVQIAGNSEVPREENVRKLFTIFLHRNATGYKIDDDEKESTLTTHHSNPEKCKQQWIECLKKKDSTSSM